MTGIKIDGKEIAQTVKGRVRKAVEELKSQGINPCLATILVGDNQASATYVKNKHKACEEVGIITKDFKFGSANKDDFKETLETIPLGWLSPYRAVDLRQRKFHDGDAFSLKIIQ